MRRKEEKDGIIFSTFVWMLGVPLIVLTMPVFLLECLFKDREHKLSDGLCDGIFWIYGTIFEAIIFLPIFFVASYGVAIYAVLWAVGGIALASLIFVVPMWLFGKK